MRCGLERTHQCDVNMWVQVSTHTVLFPHPLSSHFSLPQPCHCPSGIKAVAHSDPPASSAPGSWGFYWGGVHEELPQVVSQAPPAPFYNSPGQITGLQSAPATWEERCEEAWLGQEDQSGSHPLRKGPGA